MSVADILKAINANLGTIATALTALGTLATAGITLRTHFTRSRLLVPNAFPLPEVPGEHAIFDKEFPNLQTMMVGREREIHDLARAVKDRRLTFLYGESGSGKSTLLKLGLARELAQSGTWIPIYVDVWGQDWVRGPQKSLADATDFALRALELSMDNPVITETVFSRLAELRSKTGRRPILLFDQLDDYQNANRERFRNTGTGLFLGPDEVGDANPFWRNVRDLLGTEGDPIHVLLATRDDAESGLHCFRFEEPGVYPLARLEAADVEQLIHRLAPESVVSKPENGFSDLMARIVADLGRDHGGKVLPMQLRVALAGVGRLSGPLTLSRLERLGGVAGLGAQYVESAIQDAPGAWPVLNAMAQRTAEGRGKAALLTRQQVLALVPSGQDASRLLQKLIDARILRRRLAGSEDETWQLYHDYVADAIVALDRRKRKWALRLSEAHERFRLADGLLQRWSLLLGPFTLIRLFWQRLRDGAFRFGEHLGYVRLSLPRMVLNMWTVAAVAAYGGWVYWSEQSEAKEIASAFLQGGNSKEEFRALWRLSSTPSDRTRRMVFQELLSTPVGAERFDNNRDSAIAALGLRISSLDGLRGLAVEGPCAEFRIMSSCVALSLIAGDGARLADRILDRMKVTTGIVDRFRMREALAALAKEIHGEQAARLADRVLEQMKVTTYAFESSSPGKALAALAKETHGKQAARLADRILERMKGTTNAFELSSLGQALAALAKETHGEQAARGTDWILERMKGRTDAYELSRLGEALAALAKETHGEQAARGTDWILERMKGTTQVDELSSLGGALAALAKETHGEQAASLADRILGRMEVAAVTLKSSSLDEALATLLLLTNWEQAPRRADLIPERLKGTTPALELSSLGTALAALAKEVHGVHEAPGADMILEGMWGTINPDDASTLGAALAVLAKETHGEQAARLADLILVRMRGTTDVGDQSSLGAPLAALAGSVEKQKRLHILTKLIAIPVTVDCGAAVSQATRQELPLLVDMLKWPICGSSRNGVMLHIAELQGQDPKIFGVFEEVKDRPSFRTDIRKFIHWLKTQKGPNGKPFDVEGPPIHNPYLTPRRSDPKAPPAPTATNR